MAKGFARPKPQRQSREPSASPPPTPPITPAGERREAPTDASLIEAMRANPGASIGDLAATIHRSRTSTVSALKRLRDAGLAESVEGKWRLTEEPAPREPTPKCTAPLSVSR